MTDNRLVLAYHSVSPSPWGALSTPLRSFRDQMEWLAGAGCRGVSLREWCASDDPRAVALTFDDGYRDNLAHALPVLASLGFTATVFVVVNLISSDRQFPWVETTDRDAMPLTWDEVRALREAGVEIGSHTLSHPSLPEIRPLAAAEEIGRSRELLSAAIGSEVDSFCYPYGRFSPENCLQVRRAGYRRAVGPASSAVPVSPFTIPRVGVHRHTSLVQFRVKISRAGRALLRFRRRSWMPREAWPAELWQDCAGGANG